MINSDPDSEIKPDQENQDKLECLDFSYSNELFNDSKENREIEIPLPIQPTCPVNVLAPKQQLILNVNNMSKINICNINQSAQCLKVSTINNLNNKKVIQFKKLIKNSLDDDSNNNDIKNKVTVEKADNKVFTL